MYNDDSSSQYRQSYTRQDRVLVTLNEKTEGEERRDNADINCTKLSEKVSIVYRDDRVEGDGGGVIARVF